MTKRALTAAGGGPRGAPVAFLGPLLPPLAAGGGCGPPRCPHQFAVYTPFSYSRLGVKIPPIRVQPLASAEN